MVRLFAFVLALLAIGAAAHGGGLPANLRVEPSLRPTVETMLATSATFRAQLARLAAKPTVIVALLDDDGAGLGKRRRALTTFVRQGPRLCSAQVRIGRGYDTTALIAHELEHVLEQLDGVNLLLESQVVASGVSRAPDGTFETARAVAVGEQVSDEVQAAHRLAKLRGHSTPTHTLSLRRR
jgi:hypothetical protein